MRTHIQAALAALALAATTLAAAAQPTAGGHGRGAHGMRAMYSALSPEGRQTVTAALRSARDAGTHAQIEALRAQQLDVLAADTLDQAKLGRLQRQERDLAQAQHSRRQAAMLGAYGKLSLADRRAFVAATRAVQSDFAARREGWRAARGAGAAGGTGGAEAGMAYQNGN